MINNNLTKSEIDLQIKLLQLEKTAQTVIPRKIVAEQFFAFYSALKELIQQKIIKLATDLAGQTLTFEQLYNILSETFTEIFDTIEEGQHKDVK